MTRDEIMHLFEAELVEKQLPLKLFKVEEKKDHFLVTVCGGNNGHHNWSQYLRNAVLLMEGHDWWLVNIINDCPDDVHNITIGVNK